MCTEDFILLTNNNTCLKRSSIKEIEKFENCKQLSLDNNNKLYCSSYDYYTLLIENNEAKYYYLPSLYENFNDTEIIRQNDYYNISSPNYINYLYEQYYHNYIEVDLLPCQEAINIGTKDKPLYTCTKCYNFFEFDHLDSNFATLYTEEKNNLSYCIWLQSQKKLNNCMHAIRKSNGKKSEFSCLKCYNGNVFAFDSEKNISYCISLNSTEKCMVKYCKECEEGKNYACKSPISEDYVINKDTGSCVKKTAIIPAITWKDIFRLKMNSNKEINGRNYYGPSFIIRGLTNSEINIGHTFLIYITLKNIRNLEQEPVKIPGICQIVNSLEKVDENVNIVDYECIGDADIPDNLEN